jgi:hypothetical protein
MFNISHTYFLRMRVYRNIALIGSPTPIEPPPRSARKLKVSYEAATRSCTVAPNSCQHTAVVATETKRGDVDYGPDISSVSGA